MDPGFTFSGRQSVLFIILNGIKLEPVCFYRSGLVSNSAVHLTDQYTALDLVLISMIVTGGCDGCELSIFLIHGHDSCTVAMVANSLSYFCVIFSSLT